MILGEYRDAIIFIVKYVVLYLVLNFLYAFYVESYLPGPDPVTRAVTFHTSALMSLADPSISSHTVAGSMNVPILRGDDVIIEVFEGCNSINVLIVYVAFLIAFRGPFHLFIPFFLAGFALIYAVNLLRIAGLYVVALKFPEGLYFFHKFFFTGIIYLVVFIIWYFWIREIKKWTTAGKNSQG